MKTLWIQARTGTWHAVDYVEMFGRWWTSGMAACGKGFERPISQIQNQHKCKVCLAKRPQEVTK